MDYRSSEQTITWFKDKYRDGTLRIRPPFQRKPVWTARQKCYLIESILMKLPIPEIYVQQTVSPDGDTAHSIVDGQQRIRAILQFVGAELDPEEAEFNEFPLDKLPTTSPWRNVTFSQLEPEVRATFYGYTFAVRMLNTNNESDVRDMFLRVNKFLSPLKPQELRNATYGGPFARLATRLADDDYWAVNKIMSPALIRRMTDIEFVSELLIGVLHGPQGGSAKIIDEYYQQYEDYDDEFPGQPQAERLYERTLASINEAFPGIRDLRWSNKTDFYSLFLAISQQHREGRAIANLANLRSALGQFVREVDQRLANPKAKVSRPAIAYVRAVEKGANDKARRATRHTALTRVIAAFFR